MACRAVARAKANRARLRVLLYGAAAFARNPGAGEGRSARDDLHVQGCLILSQVGLLFPVNHAPMKLASLAGFAPVISCMRGRHVDRTTLQGQNGEGRKICASDLMHVTHPLWLAELCPRKWWG